MKIIKFIKDQIENAILFLLSERYEVSWLVASKGPEYYKTFWLERNALKFFNSHKNNVYSIFMVDGWTKEPGTFFQKEELKKPELHLRLIP